jgi:hypothetical protein
MMRKLFFILTLVIIALTNYTCCKAGMGGKASITISVLSDSKNPVYGTVVYIKYGQSTAPVNGITGFDNHITASSNSNTVKFSNLNCGTYYIYATGYDSVLASPLSGGSPLSITHHNRAKAVTTNMYITP